MLHDGRVGRRRLAAAFLLSSLLHGTLLIALSGEKGHLDAARNNFSPAGNIAPTPLIVRLPASAAAMPNDAVPSGLTLDDRSFEATPPTDWATRSLDRTVSMPSRPGSANASRSQDAAQHGFGLLPPNISGPPYPPPPVPYPLASRCEQPPVPLMPYPLELPELQGMDFAGQLIFTLLIDEQGGVQEVLHESGALEARIVEAVSARLQDLRFQPAFCQGQRAASRLRIEVSFGYRLP